jgi:dTDP-4-dehydrorhamnose reductase
MTPKILLIGKTGQIGRELHRRLPVLGEVVALDRTQMDLSRPDSVREVIRSIHPTIIVNAAAYTAVDEAEQDEAAAHVINADAPRIMAEEALRIGAALVHYSTDYVFDGSATSPYREADPTNPISAYGRSKLLGEQAIQQVGCTHLIFRTAWVYAREGKNFLLTILRLATEREELRIVDDQIGAPTWSREIATATEHALSHILQNGDARTIARFSGIYHMTAAGQASWHAFADAILHELPGAAARGWVATATNGRPLIARRLTAIRTSDFPTPARRPAYSVLSNQRLNDVLQTRLPDWRTQLSAVFSQ